MIPGEATVAPQLVSKFVLSDTVASQLARYVECTRYVSIQRWVRNNCQSPIKKVGLERPASQSPDRQHRACGHSFPTLGFVPDECGGGGSC